ncbi:MAG: dihydrolipoyl dehydrogenase [Pseudomonadota bacterium]
MQEFDLIVIGGGPAGYTGAIRAAQLGFKVAVVEKRNTLGGTCLNVGCIPSKALLHFSEKYEDAALHFADIGIKTSKLEIDLSRMMNRKDKIVDDLCKGIGGLFAKNKITRFTGNGSIMSHSVVEIKNDTEVQQISGKNILIATGSEVASLPSVNIDEKSILSSTGALALESIPKSMIVIGGGVIGLELGSVWRRLGTEVTVVEYLDRIVPGLDIETGSQFMKILEKQGIKFKLATKVVSATVDKSSVSLTVQPAGGGVDSQMTAEKILVAVGRKPHTTNLGLEKLGIKSDKRGFIEVNHKYQTSAPNIYAVGDVIPGPMLAHKAEEEAVAAVEIMAGKHGHVNYKAIPSVIYTYPEVASVGATEEELKQENISYKIGKFPFLANSRARANDCSEGFVKILADSTSDRVLGAHIIGKDAGTMIAELTLGIEFFASSEDIARTCHAHPTLSEAVKEAALAVDKRTINF